MEVECNSIKGNKVRIAKEKLIFRSAAYAVIIFNNKILMYDIRRNGKLFFPGGGINLGESVKDALKRETKEETGIEIEVEKFLTFREGFFYYDVSDEAYHTYSFYYICKPLTFDLLDESEINDQESTKPYWIEIEEAKKRANNLEVVKEIFQLL